MKPKSNKCFYMVYISREAQKHIRQQGIYAAPSAWASPHFCVAKTSYIPGTLCAISPPLSRYCRGGGKEIKDKGKRNDEN
jgi:hypothetical protein